MPKSPYDHVCALANDFHLRLRSIVRSEFGSSSKSDAVVAVLTDAYFVKLNNLVALKGGKVSFDGDGVNLHDVHKLASRDHYPIGEEIIEAARKLLRVDTHGMEG